MSTAPGNSANPTGTPLRKFPEPVYEPKLIPKERYTSRDFAELEQERLWPRTWLYAGPTSDLERVGDYFTFEIANEPILVVRSAADRIEAMFNSCQHRGSQVVTDAGCGHARRFTCPYHLWSYALDGELVEVPDREDFPQGVPQTGLRKLRCETWAGFVFVNMDPEAEPLADFLGVVSDHLAPYDFEHNYALVEDVRFEWDCNWKAGVDAFNEVYHVQGIHPELLEMSDDVDCPVDVFGKHSRFLFHVLRPSPRWTDELAQARGYKDRWEITSEVRSFLPSLGVDPETYPGDMRTLRGDMIVKMREMATATGIDFDRLNDEQLWLDVHYSLFPNLTFNISPGHFWLFRHLPHPGGDPNKMLWDFQEFTRIPRDAERPPRPPKEHARWGDGREQKLHLALRQDGDAMPAIQAGMRSRGFEGLHLAHQERRIRHWHAVLEDTMKL